MYFENGHLMAVEMTRKRPVLVIYSYYKDRPVTAVKRDAVFFYRYVKGVPFLSKMLCKRVMSWASGRSLPVENFVGCHRAPLPYTLSA